MKKWLPILFLILFSISLPGQKYLLPPVELRSVEGNPLIATSLINNNQPAILVFWNLCNSDCQRQLDALCNIQEEFLKSYNVKIVGIYVANAGNWSLLNPFLNGKNYSLDIAVDVNSTLMHSMGIPSLPFTVMYGYDKKPICAHIGFCSGMDELLCKKIEDCLKKIQ
jgi:hypothetical protein